MSKALHILKKTGKFLLKAFLILFVLINLFIIFSGNFYLYRAVYYTFLHGQASPGILDKDYFYSREVKNDLTQPWPISKNYNKRNIPAATEEKLTDLNTTSFLVIRHDSIVFEKYYDGFDEMTLSNSFSIAKSVTSLLIGIAVDEGKIKSIDDPVSQYLTGYLEGNRKKITIRHLLTMSADMDWNESAWNPLSHNAEAYYGTDIESVMEDVEYGNNPGKVFDYKSGSTQVLGMILKKVTGKSLAEYASEKIWKKIGAEQAAFWSLDNENGTEKAYCCLYAISRDFARIGKLMLNHGKWNGEKVIDSSYVAQCKVPADLKTTDGKKNDRYSLSFWITTHKGHTVFYARGIKGQYIICIPAENMIIVRTGHQRGEKRSDDQPTDLFHCIDAGLSFI